MRQLLQYLQSNRVVHNLKVLDDEFDEAVVEVPAVEFLDSWLHMHINAEISEVQTILGQHLLLVGNGLSVHQHELPLELDPRLTHLS